MVRVFQCLSLASLVSIAFVGCLFQPPVMEAALRGLNLDEARRLVVAALGPKVEKLPKFGVDLEYNQDDADFYRFEATWDNPGGSVLIGFFGVNRATGDVWRLVPCEKVGSGRLRRLQKELRRKIGLKAIERRELDKAPCEN